MTVLTYYLIECLSIIRIITYPLIESLRVMRVATYHYIEYLRIIRVANIPSYWVPQGNEVSNISY